MLKRMEFAFETDFIESLSGNIIPCEVRAVATFDSNYGSDRDGRRGVLELADLDFEVAFASPLKGSLERFDGFPLLQKAILNHCKNVAKEKASSLRSI